MRLALGILWVSSAFAQGVITTVAGNDAIFQDDGRPALSAAIAAPNGLAVDTKGNVYIASPLQNMVFKIDNKGVLTVLAGNGLQRYAGDGGPARAASLAGPTAVAIDSADNLFIADTGNSVVRRVDTTGTITTVAGSGGYGFSGDGGPATKATLTNPTGVALDSNGNLYIADQNNNVIRMVNSATVISTYAGNGAPGNGSGDGGPAIKAAIPYPVALAIDPSGNLYVAQRFYPVVRKVAPTGIISTVAGNGSNSSTGDGGLATSASFNVISAVTTDPAGYLYIVELLGERIRRVSPNGIVITLAGTGKNAFGGDGGSATAASLSAPSGVAADSTGNIYIGDRDNDRVRRIDGAGTITTFAGQGSVIGDGGPAIQARLDGLSGIAFDSAGNLYIVEQGANRVRKVTPAGVVSTLAGGRQGSAGDGGAAANASLYFPTDVKADAAGNVYISDTFNCRIRKISTTGTISTIAGASGCVSAGSGDGGPAISANVPSPSDLSIDPVGNLYVWTGTARAIRKITPSGIITTIGGGSTQIGFAGDGGPATSAVFSQYVNGLLADANGNVYIGDSGNNRVRRIDSNGIITTFAGNGSGATSGDGGPAAAAGMPYPRYLAQDRSGNIYIASASRVRMVQPDGVIRTYAGNAPAGFSGDGGPALSAAFDNPIGMAIDPAGNLLVADFGNRRIRQIQAGQSPSIIASQKGLTFVASTGGGQPPPQSFTIVNGGQGALNWGVSASTLSGGNWLSVSPGSGTSPAGAAGPPVQVTVNASGLPAGDYYGQVQILGTGAPNSPQSVTVVLSVRTPGSGTGSIVQPSGLLFTSTAPQAFTLTTLSTSPVTFSGTASFGGPAWFTLTAGSGTTVSGTPATVQVSPNPSGLATGVYNANITFAFSDNSVQSVQLLLVLAPGSGSQPEAPGPRAVCGPTKLLPLFTSLGGGFTLTTGWPSPVEVRVVDDCGTALTRGTVTASFSNADPALALNSLGDGRWTGTWQAQSAAESVTVTASAQSVDSSLNGSAQVSGGLSRNANPPPVVAQGGVLNAASYQLQSALAPGSLVSIFGTLLAQATVSAPSLPLPNTLGGATVTIAGRSLPLLFASGTQVNAQIPYDLPINATHQLIVQRGTAISVPQSVSVLSSQSGVFTKDLTGKGAAIVVQVAGDGTQSIVSPASPTMANEALVIYCAGLGDVDPRQIAGQQVPFTPLSSTLDTVTVTIGGVNAPVFFAGVTPGFTGLYQVNVYVPAGLTPGDNVPLVITQAGRNSPPVSISVR
jgi:uncharacterized protein (TIGR03437 family)